MGNIYFDQNSYDSALESEAFGALRPTFSQEVGEFSDSIKESFGIGSLLKQRKLNEAGRYGSIYASEEDVKVGKEYLQEKYGIPGYLDFTDRDMAYTENQAKVLREQKLTDISRALTYEHSTMLGKAIRFGSDFVYQMADPLGLAVGEVIKPAQWLSKFLPKFGGHIAVAADKEAMLSARAASAFTGTSINAAGGTAALLPYAMAVDSEYQSDISMGEALTMIAFGGVSGGILHAGGLTVHGLFHKGLKPIAHDVDAPLPQTRSADTHAKAFEKALVDLHNGEPTDISEQLALDPVIKAINEAKELKAVIEEDPAIIVNSKLPPLMQMLTVDQASINLVGGVNPFKNKYADSAIDLTGRIELQPASMGHVEAMVDKLLQKILSLPDTVLGLKIIKAIRAYQQGNSVNKDLKAAFKSQSILATPDVYLLDKASDMGVLTVPHIFERFEPFGYSGLSEELVKSGQIVGKIYLMPGFMSVSVNATKSPFNHNSVRWVIEAEPGVKGFWGNTGQKHLDPKSTDYLEETEYVLGRNQILYITDAYVDDTGKSVIHARVINDDNYTMERSSVLNELLVNQSSFDFSGDAYASYMHEAPVVDFSKLSVESEAISVLKSQIDEYASMAGADTNTIEKLPAENIAEAIKQAGICYIGATNV